jgi:hypothetical protein
MAITGSFGSFSSMRNTEVSTECSVPDSSSTRSEVPAAKQQQGQQCQAQVRIKQSAHMNHGGVCDICSVPNSQ